MRAPSSKGNSAGEVDKFVGTAYDIMKVIHENLDALKTYAEDSSVIVAAASVADTQSTLAQQSAQAAATSEANAAASESVAVSSKDTAVASATAAATSESNAASSESNAAASEASASADAASTASDASATAADRTATESARVDAEQSAAEANADKISTAADRTAVANDTAAAAASAAAAATSETNAASSETNAASSATTAEAAADSVQFNLIPMGMVTYFASPTAPVGWLECNGSSVSAAYPDLRQFLLDAGSPYGMSGSDPLLPDLRGNFLRGWDNSRGLDVGRVFGSWQADAIKAHYHTVNPPSTTTSSNGKHHHSIRPTTSGSTGGGGSDDWAAGSGSGLNTSSNGAHTHTLNIPEFDSGSTGGTETTVKNVAILPCIKAYGSLSPTGMADLAELLNSVATEAEVLAGTDNTKLVTPFRLRQALGNDYGSYDLAGENSLLVASNFDGDTALTIDSGWLKRTCLGNVGFYNLYMNIHSFSKQVDNDTAFQTYFDLAQAIADAGWDRDKIAYNVFGNAAVRFGANGADFNVDTWEVEGYVDGHVNYPNMLRISSVDRLHYASTATAATTLRCVINLTITHL